MTIVKLAALGLLSAGVAAAAPGAEPVRPKVRALAEAPPFPDAARPTRRLGAAADPSKANGLAAMPLLPLIAGLAALSALVVSAAGDSPVSPD